MTLLDRTIGEYEDRKWRWELDPTPDIGFVEADKIPEPLDITDVVFRTTHGVQSMSNAFDLILDYQGNLDEAAVGTLLKSGKLEETPEIIQPKVRMPDGAKMQCIIQKLSQLGLRLIQQKISLMSLVMVQMKY